MAVDSKKASLFNCQTCDRASQRLRNCTGNGKPAVNILNNAVFERCPKSLWLESKDARDLFHLYIECRELKLLPDQGSVLDQTAFTVELFKYLDGLMSEHRRKVEEQHKNQTD